MTVKNLTDLRDSKIVYDRNPPELGYWLLAIVAVGMIALVVWSTKAPKTYICQAGGTVQSENKTYIMSSYSGSITEMYVSEGSFVNEGDRVAHLKSTELDLQREQYEGQLELYRAQLAQYEKLIRSIQDNRNYFDETSADDQPYYYQYESYQSQVAQNSFDASAYAGMGYTSAQIQTLIEQNQSRVEQIYYSFLQSASEQVTALQTNIQNLNNQLSMLDTGASDYTIYAPTSGTIHMDTAYKEGMVLSAGSVLATVASENSDYEIIAYISLGDRPLIHEGDICTIAVTGLAQNVYGTLKGRVQRIDSDMTSSGSGAAYKLSIAPESTYLVSKNGDKVDLYNGMSVTARIVYDKITYFQYVLEALGVLTR